MPYTKENSIDLYDGYPNQMINDEVGCSSLERMLHP